MKISDSDHYLLISVGILALPCYVSVLLSRDYRWVRPFLRYCIVALLAVFSYAYLMYFAPSSFTSRITIAFGTIAGFFCLWRLFLGVGIQMASDIGVAAIALLIAPVVFSHNSELISLSLASTTGTSVPSWVGYTVLSVALAIFLLLVRYAHILPIFRSLSRIVVASFIVFLGIRLAALEGPAPGFVNTDLYCFEMERAALCPFGLEDPLASSALAFLIVFAVLVFYRRRIFCCWYTRGTKGSKSEKQQLTRTKAEKEEDEAF